MNRLLDRKETGVILVEFAIILPIILLITIGAFEITRAIRIVGVASKLSYEVAKVAIKECFDGGENIGVQPFDACMQERVTGIQNLASTIVPGSRIFLNYYAVPNTTGTYSSWPIFRRFSTSATGEPAFDTSISKTTDFLNARVNNLKEHRKIIVGECFLPYTPLFGYVRLFLPFRTSGSYLYDATII